MGRSFLSAVLLLIWIASPAQAEPHLAQQSRLLAAIVERYAADTDALCFIGTKMSPRFKYSRFDLPDDFRALFMQGQLGDKRVDDIECEGLGSLDSQCKWGCATVNIFDMSAVGYPTPWSPWPYCAQENISFLRGLEQPSGNPVMMLNIYWVGAWTKYLNVYSIGPCRFLVFDAIVIE